MFALDVTRTVQFSSVSSHPLLVMVKYALVELASMISKRPPPRVVVWSARAMPLKTRLSRSAQTSISTLLNRPKFALAMSRSLQFPVRYGV